MRPKYMHSIIFDEFNNSGSNEFLGQNFSEQNNYHFSLITSIYRKPVYILVLTKY